MYDELIEALRSCTNPNKYCEDCGFFDKCCLSKEHFSIEEQAADAIEELQKKYDETQDALITADITRVYLEDVLKYIKTLAENYKAHNRWIPVTERLPEDYEQVLTCDENGNIHIFAHLRHFEYPFGIRPNDSRYYMPKWWMPLPKPPESGEA